MTLDRPTKTFLAVFTLVAALLIGVNHAIQQTPLEEWWLPALLLLISVALWVWMWQENIDEDTTSLTVVNTTEPDIVTQEWIISKEQTVTTSSNSVKSAEDALRREMDKTVATITQSAPVTEVTSTDSTSVDVPPADPVTVAAAEETAAEPTSVDVPPADPVTVAAAEETVMMNPSAEDVKAEVTKEATAASDGEVDDLERVEGIGPKYADALVAAGIRTFADVANATVEQFEKAAKDAGMRRSASMATWAEQAALAAKGDWDGLNALQEKLSGGRH